MSSASRVKMRRIEGLDRSKLNGEESETKRNLSKGSKQVRDDPLLIDRTNHFCTTRVASQIDPVCNEPICWFSTSPY
jgi:hypothetical protein